MDCRATDDDDDDDDDDDTCTYACLCTSGRMCVLQYYSWIITCSELPVTTALFVVIRMGFFLFCLFCCTSHSFGLILGYVSLGWLT
jgi:hypothetical protein